MKKKTQHCIIRVDRSEPRSQHGWLVKIARGGSVFTRSFADSKHGGRRAALALAIKCRDAELVRRPVKNSFAQATTLRATNSSGIVGVRRTKRKVKRDGRVWEYDVWVATGTPVAGGRAKTRYFSVDALGPRKAKAAAIEQRAAWERSLRASVKAAARAAR